MRFYRATSFIFPRHYEWRLLLVCFGAVHVPLIACVCLQAITGHWEPVTLITLLAATLLGTGLGLAAIRALLQPIGQATAMLRAVQHGEPVHDVPRAGEDLVGRLLESVTLAARESSARLKRLTLAAERDPLTGIRNRRGFLDSAAHVLDDAHTSVLAVIDIDHFKLVNDQFGHSAGDELLRTFARRLEDGLRRSDLACRWGGEEFAVLLPDTHLDEARMIMERLRASVALDEHLVDQGWPVTFSCGLAPIRAFAEFDDTVKRADQALYVAKNNGRNRVHAAD